MKKKPFYTFMKRFFDIVCSILAIIILSPFLLIIAIIVKCTSKGPVLFKQERYGKNRKVFKLWKFRTMKINTDPNLPTWELDDPDEHITKVGKTLRKTSIDELPQLFNILSGKMSFVGPRPGVLKQIDLIEKRDAYHANDVRPGLTGLAQISGRDNVNHTMKAKIDGEYILKRSLFFDLKIILKTFGVVIKQKGINEGAPKKKEALEDNKSETKEDNKETTEVK